MNKGILGKPKYSKGDKVTFKFRFNIETMEEETIAGEIYIVDAYGTFFDESEPSYDIFVEHYSEGDKTLFKHIPESRINRIE